MEPATANPGSKPTGTPTSDTSPSERAAKTCAKPRLLKISRDGRAYAKMRSDLRFDEEHIEPGLRGGTFAVDEVTMVDDLERLPGAHKVGYWTPKTYRLCYQRIGEGPFRLTFSETGVVPNEQIKNPRGHVDALATDGRGYAKMRSDLRFDEDHVEPGLRGSTFAVDEVTMLDCRIRDDAMTVSAGVYGTRDGEPWFKARWHADVRHVPE